MGYAHPAYTRESVAAQSRLPGLNTTVTAFAGAYHGWGFHEDGCRSGVAARLAAHWERRLVTAALYECRISHARRAPLRNAFSYRTYQWLVDLDDLPSSAGLAAAARRIPRPRSPGRSGPHHPGQRRRVPARRTASTWAAAGC